MPNIITKIIPVICERTAMYLEEKYANDFWNCHMAGETTVFDPMWMKTFREQIFFVEDKSAHKIMEEDGFLPRQIYNSIDYLMEAVAGLIHLRCIKDSKKVVFSFVDEKGFLGCIVQNMVVNNLPIRLEVSRLHGQTRYSFDCLMYFVESEYLKG